MQIDNARSEISVTNKLVKESVEFVTPQTLCEWVSIIVLLFDFLDFNYVICDMFSDKMISKSDHFFFSVLPGFVELIITAMLSTSIRVGLVTLTPIERRK